MLPVEKRINSKSDLKEWLDVELRAYNVGALQRIFPFGETAILRKHQILLRKTEYYLNTNKKTRSFLYRLRLSVVQNKYAMHVAKNCCGKGLRIMHVGPILMNSRVCVGENCIVHMNSALVAGGNNDDVPTLGNGVIVGYGAVVLGNVTVADNVAIGANAVVNRDVLEENIAVAGVPAKKISNNGAIAWLNRAN